jgi:hypothetical protein
MNRRLFIAAAAAGAVAPLPAAVPAETWAERTRGMVSFDKEWFFYADGRPAAYILRCCTCGTYLLTSAKNDHATKHFAEADHS